MHTWKKCPYLWQNPSVSDFGSKKKRIEDIVEVYVDIEDIDAIE